MASIKQAYLLGYNATCALGWAYVLLLSAKHLGALDKPQALYDDVARVLHVVQTAALMEVRGAKLNGLQVTE